MSAFREGSSFLKGGGIHVSDTNAHRMIERHKRIIDANVEHIRDKTILDLASHNGRWSYAAIVAGAQFVMGIEGRQYLIDRGMPEFADIDSSKYKFACGDIFEMRDIVRSSCGLERFDTIFCLGVFYHISDHYRLLRLMAGFRPDTIILDGSFLKTDEMMVRFRLEDPEDHSMAIREVGGSDKSVAGVASFGFLKTAARLNGYEVTNIPWKRSGTTYPDAVEDYFDDPNKNSRRLTLKLTARTESGPPVG